MTYHTTMKSGYEFVGSLLPPNGGKNTKTYAKWINQYCNLYKYDNKPMDACAIAGLITTEVGAWPYTQNAITWNPLTVADDNSKTGSRGLGQFTTGTGPNYGIYNKADQQNPEKNIKAMCQYMSKNLLSANGDYTLAYEKYNAGTIYNNPGKDLRKHMANYASNYKWWTAHGQGKSATTPVKTADNTKAVEDAKAKKKADDIAKSKLADKLHAQDVKEQADDKKAIDKAKLTNDAKKLATAQATAKANALKRAKALAQAKVQKVATDKANTLKTANAYKSKNPYKNTPSTPTSSAQKNLPTPTKDYSKNKVLGSGLSIFGAIAIAVVIGNGFIPKESLE